MSCWNTRACLAFENGESRYMEIVTRVSPEIVWSYILQNVSNEGQINEVTVSSYVLQNVHDEDL